MLPEEIASVVIRILDFSISSASIVYILVKKKYRTTHQITCFHLISVDLVYVCVITLTLEYLDSIDSHLLAIIFFIAADFLAILHVVVVRLWAIWRPLKYGHKHYKNVIILFLHICWGFPGCYCLVGHLTSSMNPLFEVMVFMALPTFSNMVLFIMMVSMLCKRKHVQSNHRVLGIRTLHSLSYSWSHFSFQPLGFPRLLMSCSPILNNH